MSLFKKLTEGLVQRDLKKEDVAMVNKWEETGLLEGLEDKDSQRSKTNMAILLENQAKRLLKEATIMSAGDVEGVAANTFPLVRRVFGQVIANELVSVQPMSLPAGLIFFMDFQRTGGKLHFAANESVFGGGVVGQQITGGVSLTGANIELGYYNLSNGYSAATGTVSAAATLVASGTALSGNSYAGTAAYTALGDRLVRFDPDLKNTVVAIVTVPASSFTNLSTRDLVAIHATASGGNAGRLQHRLTQVDPTNSANYMFVFAATGSETTNLLGAAVGTTLGWVYPTRDALTTGGALSTVVGTSPWNLENTPNIAELDMKIDAVDIRAETKKLKAKWTPEVQQDINAYHGVDAEAEMTGVMTEQITLDIDMELLEDLVKGATAGTYYWSRLPGKFLDRTTGLPVSTSANESLFGADFTGNVSQWYETLVETINDCSAQIQRKTLRGGATFLVCGPEVANILEFTEGFRASTTHDEPKGTVGSVKSGSLRKKWDVHVHSYFPRNVILIGRKGSSFLESGYVYAPYVPLQITPTIIGQEDGVPRKILMTRYAKKMVRPDFYGLVVISDFI